MLTYARIGDIDYAGQAGIYVSRPEWEFEACLKGGLGPRLSQSRQKVEFHERVLWAFPSGHAHGWQSRGVCRRAVFHFSSVPKELELNIPTRGYYQVSLSAYDCDRVRRLAESALDMIVKPTELQNLVYDSILTDLSLLALREINFPAQTISDRAKEKVEAAQSWYRKNIHDCPSYKDVARAVNVSPSYLRELFYRNQDASPQQALSRIRLEVATDMLYNTSLKLEDIAASVGFSCGSALSRAMKAHFGAGPRQLRTRKSWAPESAKHDLPFT